MIRLLRILVLLAGTIATMLPPMLASGPAEARSAAACGPRGCGAAHCGPRGCAAAGTRHPGYRPGYPAYRPGYHPGYRPGYPGYRPPGVVVVNPHRYWAPGGAIAAGAAIGFIAGATAVAIAGQPPKPNYCWYYTSPAKTTGFWDVCPR